MPRNLLVRNTDPLINFFLLWKGGTPAQTKDLERAQRMLRKLDFWARGPVLRGHFSCGGVGEIGPIAVCVHLGNLRKRHPVRPRQNC